MTRNLFAYGTLLVPEIWNLVVGKSFSSEPAFLPGYGIFRVKGGDFPGIAGSGAENASVPGRIFHDLDEGAIARLDAYEDTFYERIEIPNVTSETGDTVTCDSYVVPESLAPDVLSDEIWTLEWFKNAAQTAYIARMQGVGFLD